MRAGVKGLEERLRDSDCVCDDCGVLGEVVHVGLVGLCGLIGGRSQIGRRVEIGLIAGLKGYRTGVSYVTPTTRKFVVFCWYVP